ncbi:MAG TPA: DciA family protein [Candidatus Baltobacteraceae bacterium]|nr:DciA family protein [Candidatus Baltobacteraceae bacterium]
MFTKIGTILPESMEKSGLAPKLAKARVLSIFEERARALLPESLALAFKTLRLEQGTLTVACKTSAAAYALKAAEPELREGLEEAGVLRIRFLLAPWR